MVSSRKYEKRFGNFCICVNISPKAEMIPGDDRIGGVYSLSSKIVLSLPLKVYPSKTRYHWNIFFIHLAF